MLPVHPVSPTACVVYKHFKYTPELSVLPSQGQGKCSHWQCHANPCLTYCNPGGILSPINSSLKVSFFKVKSDIETMEQDH